MDDVYIVWRIAMWKVWRVPWSNHCNLLPHLAGVMDLELWFSTNVGLNGTHSIMGRNWRHSFLRSEYRMEVCNHYEKLG